MYSPTVVDVTLSRLAKKGVVFQRRSVEDSLDISAKLQKIWNDGKHTRNFTKAENDFMSSEVVICRADFRYWAERYGFSELDASDGGGVGPVKFWPSQERALELVAAREEQNFRELEKYGFTSGLRVVYHKTRQQGATSLMRLVCGHRMTLYKHTRALAVTLDDTKILELYKRDHIWLENLAFFLNPVHKDDDKHDTKGQQLFLRKMHSGLVYQKDTQETGIGTGQQFDVSHLTEVALYANPWRLEFDLLPAIPKSFYTFTGWESTANGRGEDNFWHQFTENVRHKRAGFGDWVYVFTPAYANDTKNRLAPPDDWRPNENTIRYAETVEATSAEFMGRVIRPGKPHLYWYESEWEKNKRMGSLAIFHSSYPATPELSFQHQAQTALPIEVIERMRHTALKGMPYLVEWQEHRG